MKINPLPSDRRLLMDCPESIFEFLWRASSWHQVCICVLALVVAFLTVAPIELHRRIVDDVIVAGKLELLLSLGAVYLGIILAKLLLKYLFQLYQGWIIESTALRLRRELLEHYESERRDYPDAGEDAEGTAVTIIGAEADKVAGFVGEGLSLIVMNLGMLLAVTLYMLSEQWLIGLVALAILLPQVIVVPLLQRRINALVEKRLYALRCLGEDVVEMSQSSGERNGDGKVEIDGAERAGGRVKAIFDNRLKIYFWKFLSKNFVNFMNTLSPAVLLIFGGYLVIEGETTLGVIVAFLSGLERIADPLRDLVAHYREIAQSRVQYQHMVDWVD